MFNVFCLGGCDSTTNTASEDSPGCGSISTLTPLLARRPPTSATASGDMPPSYSGLLTHGEVVINCSPPCYQVIAGDKNIVRSNSSLKVHFDPDFT